MLKRIIVDFLASLILLLMAMCAFTSLFMAVEAFGHSCYYYVFINLFICLFSAIIGVCGFEKCMSINFCEKEKENGSCNKKECKNSQNGENLH